MHKKRIAIIVPGGVGNGFFNQGVPELVNLINGLSINFEITVYSMVAVNPNFRPENYYIRSIIASYKDWTPWRMVKLGIMIIRDHKKAPYDLIHGIWGGASGMLAVFLGKMLSRSSIVSLRGGETAAVKEISYGNLLKKTKQKWLFKTLHAADYVTALTHFQADILKRYGIRKKIIVVPSGVDTHLFTPVKKTSAPPFNFLHVANLNKVKDQETLLRAFRLIRDQLDCTLKIAGADYLDGKIHRLCKELDLSDSVVFLGPIKNIDLPQHFGWAHVLLHTSLYEAQAVVVVEAAASKVLVAGTRTGIIADLKKESISVNPRDFKALAEKILTISQNKKQWESIVESAFRWAITYDIRYTVKVYSNIYNSGIKS